MKELCYLGKVCRAEPSGPKARFARLDRWLPEVNLGTIALPAAQEELLLRYLRGFGPATIANFAHWAGFRVGEAQAIFAATVAHLATVEIEGLKGPYWLRKADLSALLDESERRRPAPSTAAPPKEKGRFLAGAHSKRIFRKAGWVIATVWAKGRVAGTWKDEQAECLAVLPLGEGPACRAGGGREPGRLLGAKDLELRVE